LQSPAQAPGAASSNTHTNIKNMSRQLKIYIAGKVSNGGEVTPEEWQIHFNKFCRAESMLQELGFETVNPMRLVSQHVKNWAEAMKICIPKMCECDAIHLLPDWNQSRGAEIEYSISNKLGFVLVDDNYLKVARQSLERKQFDCLIKE